MNKASAALAAFILAVLTGPLAAGPAFADWYRWTDEEGVIHITDDFGRVPEKERGKAEVYLPAPPGELMGVDRGEARPPEPAYEKHKAGELYGDETLEWWKEHFDKLAKEIGEIESGLVAKKQYIDIFEGGRRFGQIYGDKEVETYKRFKKEVKEDEARVGKLRKKLAELRRKARIVGVPRAVMK